MKKLLAALLMTLVTMHCHGGDAPAGESRFAQVDNIKVHYTNFGAADATLVFVHGWIGDETVWSEQAAPLAAQNVRILTIDLPGHGQSDKPEIAYTMPLYARAIDAVLRDARVARAVLVGHSNGTSAVRQFYRDFPTSVSALIIVDGGLRPFVDAAAMRTFLAPMRGPDYPKVIGSLVEAITKPIRDEELRRRIKSTMLRTPPHVGISEFEATADPALWKPDPIEVPVLIVLAKQPSWTPQYEQFVRTFIPHLDYQVWEDVSHFLMMEKPEEFNSAVMKFLRTNLILPERS